MTRTVLTLLLSCLLAACAGEQEQTPGDRFGDDGEPTRTDDVSIDRAKDNPPTNDDDAASAAPSTTNTPTANAVNTCESARDLGAIAGDIDGSSVAAQGTCSEWFRITVTEASIGPLAAPMILTATLVSPLDADFDLHVFVNEATNTIECSTESDASTLPASRIDTVKLPWGEKGYTANGNDDSRQVSIEVRAKDPANCGKGNWALVLQGGP